MYSIAGILNFNIFGIPMVGADICGFGGSTTEELCTRWMQLGAFYPFSRNHNTVGAPDQDPASFSVAMQQSTIHALQTRYELLPFLYTLFYQSHFEGTAVATPLFFHWSNDSHTYHIDKQFMWGSELLITPVLTKGDTTVQGYFPAGIWYDYFTMVPLYDGNIGAYLTIDAPLEKINLHMYGGSIILTQPPNGSLTTDDARMKSYVLKVYPNGQGQASGSAYLDDGISLRAVEDNKYSLMQYKMNNNILNARVARNYPSLSFAHLDNVVVGNVSSKPKSVSFNDQPFPIDSWTYDQAKKILKVNNMNWPVDKKFTLKWS